MLSSCYTFDKVAGATYIALSVSAFKWIAITKARKRCFRTIIVQVILLSQFPYCVSFGYLGAAEMHKCVIAVDYVCCEVLLHRDVLVELCTRLLNLLITLNS